jgi:phage terminase small subunit
MADRPLTPKQQRFVEEYLVDMNATQAYRRAGYKASSDNVAAVNAHTLLKNHKVAAALAAARAKLSSRTEVTQDRVLNELRRLAFADIRKLFTWDEHKAAFVPSRDLTDDEAAAVSEINSETIISRDAEGKPRAKIKLKLKTYDKLGALEKLAKHLGMFVDRVEHTGKNGGPIETREMTDAELVERAHAQANRLTGLPVARTGNGNGNGRR